MTIRMLTSLVTTVGLFAGAAPALAQENRPPVRKTTTITTETTTPPVDETQTVPLQDPYGQPSDATNSNQVNITNQMPPKPTETWADRPPPVPPQPVVVVVPPPPPAPPAPPAPPPPRPLRERVGTAIEVGGGVANFTGGEAANRTDLGGYWDVRAVAGMRHIVGFEAAYAGSAQGITSLGLDQNAMLVKNGVEGDLRLNAPFKTRTALLSPYAFGGLGYSRYNLANTTNASTSDMRSSDDIMTLPLGGGVAASSNGFVVDARFTYRMTYFNDLFQTGATDGRHGDLNSWTLGANVGYEF